jgi:hypothetical protein
MPRINAKVFTKNNKAQFLKIWMGFFYEHKRR